MKLNFRSQAFPLNKVEERVSSLLYQLYLHYLKVKLYPKHTAQNHWKNEIFSFIVQIRADVNFVKTPTGKVKETTLNRWFIQFLTQDRFDDLVEYLRREYGETSNILELKEIQNATLKLNHALLTVLATTCFEEFLS